MKENQVNKTNNHICNIDCDNFLKEFSFDSCMNKYCHLKNAKEAFLIESPTFYSISRQFGENFLKNFLKGWLIELNENYNFSKTQTEEQINKTVSFICIDFGYLKMSEWFLFITKVERASYGLFYESIDISKIYAFLREYESERISAINRMHSEIISNNISINEFANLTLKLLKNRIKIEDLIKKI